MAEVSISDLTKVFPGGTTALEHVNLDVADSEFVVLVGPSGCGKSTLLRIVAGLESATGGTVSIGGRVVDDLSPRDRDIAMVFQSYALYPHMTVAENLGFSLRVRKVPKETARQQVTDTAHVLALDSLLNRKPAALSGGQRQRVAMGRAIVRHPAVFLMDEPLSNLDAKLRVAMRGELTRLHQRYRTTTLYVTHDQVEAMTLGDRIAVLDQGRLQQVGTPHDLYRFPRNVFVAGFIGSPAMNIGRGRLVPSGDPVHEGLILVAGNHRWPLPAAALRLRPGLAGYAGREVYFGLRPHHLRLVEDRDGVPRLPVTALTVESLGHETNVLFLPPFDVAPVGAGSRRDESELTAMWTAAVEPSVRILAGSGLTLGVDLASAHFFDIDTGEAIAMVDDIDEHTELLATAAGTRK